MLSYISRIASDFRKQHGYPPNTLLLNPEHLARLRTAYVDVDIDIVLSHLDMEIRIEPESQHPHVAWFDTSKRAHA